MYRIITKQALDGEGGEDGEGVDRGSPKSVRGNYPSTAGNLGRWKVERGVWIQCRGRGFASRTDKFIGGKFRNAANPKDGFAIADCEDSRAKRVLEFLVPILYSGKPTGVTVTIGNTIFGALLGERTVDWGILLQAVVAKLVDGVRKFKATPIGPYLFHLYIRQELLNREEMVACKIGLDLRKYDCTPDPDPDQG